MNIERIYKVADLLSDRVPEELFDMSCWGIPDEDGETVARLRLDGDDGKPAAVDLDCGMSACLGGWATVALPDVLRLVVPYDDDEEDVRDVEAVVETVEQRPSPYGHRDTWPLYSGEIAVAYALDVCDDCARDLTSPSALHRYPTEAATALRLMANGWPWGRISAVHDDTALVGEVGRAVALRSYPDHCRFAVRDCRLDYARAKRGGAAAAGDGNE